MCAVEIIALDLMDTVVRDPFFHVLPRALGMPLAQLVPALNGRAWIEFETGTIDETTYLGRALSPQAPAALKANQLRRLITHNYAFVSGMEALCAELQRAGRRLWVLSNYSPWFAIIRRELRLDRFFEDYVLSFETGQRKPAPAAYQALLARCGQPAQSVLFVDDRQVNVDGATAAGLQGLCFEDSASLRRWMARGGLL